jgi:hypothetical protein
MHDLHDRGIVDLMSDLGHLLEDPSACKSCIPKQSTCIGPLPSSSLVQRRRPKGKKKSVVRRTPRTLVAVLGAWTSRALNGGSDDASSLRRLCENRA